MYNDYPTTGDPLLDWTFFMLMGFLAFYLLAKTPGDW